MGEETTLLDLLPGVHNLKAFLYGPLHRELLASSFPSHFSITHVLSTILVFVFVLIGAMAFKSAMNKGGEHAIVPPRTFSLRLLFEMFADAVYSTAEGIMGPKNAKRFFPLIGSFAAFIFFSNCLALIPGFAPPTSVVKTTVALSLTVFVLTHVYGFIEMGPAYLKHFLGPVWYLAWLMLPIEIISHLARPVSLAIRLAGNMAADHKVVAAFFTMVPLLVPVPFLILGVLVAVVQTLVFSLLTMVYIQGAVDHGHGDDHDHDVNGHEHTHHHYENQVA